MDIFDTCIYKLPNFGKYVRCDTIFGGPSQGNGLKQPLLFYLCALGKSSRSISFLMTRLLENFLRTHTSWNCFKMHVKGENLTFPVRNLFCINWYTCTHHHEDKLTNHICHVRSPTYLFNFFGNKTLSKHFQEQHIFLKLLWMKYTQKGVT